MKVDSLDGLTAAFDRWRRKKSHIRERVPDELWERALRSARVHGIGAVARATKIEGRRLAKRESSRKKERATPTFTRLEIPRSSASTSPIAEVETATGLKLRVFTQTPETIGLLSSMCGLGGAS
jgi:hypothetical protein